MWPRRARGYGDAAGAKVSGRKGVALRASNPLGPFPVAVELVPPKLALMLPVPNSTTVHGVPGCRAHRSRRRRVIDGDVAVSR